MIPAALPPVGDAVRAEPSCPPPGFEGFQAIWVQSGTAALALAMLHIRAGRPDITAPEVIVPGYGCPDLVSAAVYAGCRPVVVDIGENDPGYDLRALENAVSPHTVAVMAVNFLGIRERSREIRGILPSPVALLEDNAQCHPEPETLSRLAGDYVVTSFARGKPASVLGGGLLLVRDTLEVDQKWLHRVVRSATNMDAKHRIQYRSRLALYNVLRHPNCYYWIEKTPFLQLGKTRYRPLDNVLAMPGYMRSMVSCNLGEYLNASRWREDMLDDLMGGLTSTIPLATDLSHRRGRLLRYPVLCESERNRNRIWRRLRALGLGASPMYGLPLPNIHGVRQKILLPAEVRGANRFSERILTLPVHSNVKEHHLQKIAAILAREDPARARLDSA